MTLPSSAVGIAAAVRDGRVAARDVVERHLALLDEYNPALNAVVIEDRGRALRAAEVGPRGALAGVPFTVKEAIAAEGLAGREASHLRPLEIAAADATAVARLRAAGAILLGKTNTSELCAHPDSCNLVYGCTRNPHDGSRSAGGSSGGEGAAVGSGISVFGIGSDYGGSIRAPAHFCGVAAIRPGPGRVPADGHLPHEQPAFRRAWTAIGPLAATVDDLEAVLSVLAGEPIGFAALPDRIGIFRDALDRPVSPDCAAAVDRAAGALACDVREETPPFQLAAERLYDSVSASETRGLLDALGTLDGASPQLLRIAAAVADAPAVPRDAPDRARELEADAAAWFERTPILLAPAASEPAFELDTERDVFGLFEHCKLASALRLPAAVVQAGRTAGGLPVGVQVIGRRGQEAEVLAVARAIESDMSQSRR